MSGIVPLLNNFGFPQDALLAWTFYGIAGLTCLCALFVVLSRNIFHSALFLAATLIGIACVYLYLGAEFLAVVQILIYVGAIVTLFIFVIMLTADIHLKPIQGINQHTLLSVFVSLAVLAIFITIININPWPSLPPVSSLSLAQIGRSIMSDYVLPFEVISLISLAALVGAIVIGKAEKR